MEEKDNTNHVTIDQGQVRSQYRHITSNPPNGSDAMEKIRYVSSMTSRCNSKNRDQKQSTDITQGQDILETYNNY